MLLLDPRSFPVNRSSHKLRGFYHILHQRLGRGIAWLLAVSLLHGVSLTAISQVSSPKPRDDRRLEVNEELSESLANDLLQLSVATRDRDLALTGEYFPASFIGKPFPARPGETVSQVKWIGLHKWDPAATMVKTAAGDTAPVAITAKVFLQTWSEFLDHFSEIEDARFKVKEANFDDNAQAVLGADEPTAVVGAKGRARIAFYVIGRDVSGKREWARGTFWADVRYAANKHWQFDSFELASFDSLVARKDMFSEVAVPARVGATLPAFGTPENSGFVWHGAAAADIDGD